MRSGGLGLGARRWLLSALVPAGIALGALITPTDVSWGQVQPIVELKDGYAKTTLWNRSTELLRVSVEPRHGEVVDGNVQLGAPVDAIVSPRLFQFGPGETQTLRILVRERLAPGAVLRLVTLFEPVVPETPTKPNEVVTRLDFATRYITKVVAP